MKEFNLKGIAIIFLISVVGIIIKYGFPLFPLMVCILFVFNIFNKNSLKISFQFISIVFLQLIFFVWMVFSLRFYGIVMSELINIISLNLLIIIMIQNIQSVADFNYFLEKFKKYTLLFTVFFSIISLIKFFSFALFRHKFSVFDYLGFSMNTSLSMDYNFFALGILFGLIIAYSMFLKETNSKLKIRYLIYMALFTFVIVFSGSRRAIVILFLFFIYLGYLKLKSVKYMKFVISQKKFNLILGIIITLIIAFFILKQTGVIESFYRGNAKYIVMKTFDRFLTLISTSEDVRATSSREVLWNKSMELYYQYNFFEQLFGSGFDYMDVLGKVMNKSEMYPHSPLLSHLLFSGIIGLVFLIITYFQIILLYLRYRKQLRIFMIMFFLTLFFIQFSGNTFFDQKIFLLLAILPIVYNGLPYNNDDEIGIRKNHI